MTIEMVTERHVGMREARKWEKRAIANGWQYRLIERANGLRGMYARTDIEITRPITDEELAKRAAKAAQEAEDEKLLAEALKIVPVDLLQCGFVNANWRVRITSADAARFGYPQKFDRWGQPMSHVDLADVIQAKFPLSERQAKLITQSKCFGRLPGEYKGAK